MTLYDDVANGIIKEAEYKAELDLSESQQDIEESYGKRGFSRKPGLMARQIRLSKEAYGDAIRAAHAAALDKVEQLKLSEYETQQQVMLIDRQYEYDLQKLSISDEGNRLKLSDDTDTQKAIEQLGVDKARDIAEIDLKYTRIEKEIDAHGDSAQALERAKQRVITDIDVANINLSSDKVVQQISLDADIAAKRIGIDYDKDSRIIKLQANIDAEIDQSQARNDASVNEAQARVNRSIAKDQARLEAAINEGDAKVENSTDISETRIKVATTSGQVKLGASRLVHDARMLNLNNETDARITNIIDENEASLATTQDIFNARLAAIGSDKQTRLDVLSNENNARLDNINNKLNADSSLRQAVLSEKLDNAQIEQAARTIAVDKVNDAEIEARIQRAEAAQNRASNRAVAVQDAAAITNQEKIIRLERRISNQSANRAQINDAELKALADELVARLDAVNISGDSKLLTSQVVDLARINNDIAISKANIETQREITLATTTASESGIVASSQASNIRLDGSAKSKAITQSSNANIQASNAYTRNNIDFLNAWGDAYIATFNNVQHNIHYKSRS